MFLAFFAAAHAEELQALAARLRPAVVMLETRNMAGHRTGNGTGFLIEADGLVVTNEHVAAAGPTVAVFADGSEQAVVGVIASDAEADVALLKVEGGGYPTLKLGAPTAPQRGDRVFVIGSPMGLDQTVTEGIVSALRPDGVPDEPQNKEVARTSLLQITATIAPGSSGSPVLNFDGDVVGVAQSASVMSATYFAVDIGAVEALRARTPVNAEPTPIPRQGWLLVQAFGFVLLVVLLALTPGYLEARRARR